MVESQIPWQMARRQLGRVRNASSLPIMECLFCVQGTQEKAQPSFSTSHQTLPLRAKAERGSAPWGVHGVAGLDSDEIGGREQRWEGVGMIIRRAGGWMGRGEAERRRGCLEGRMWSFISQDSFGFK